MQMLKLSLSLPDDAHPDMELHVSTNDAEYDVVIAVAPARAGMPCASSDEPSGAEAYVLGGYAGI